MRSQIKDLGVYARGCCVKKQMKMMEEKTEGGNGFLVQDVELVADGGDGDTGSGGKDGSLGNQGVARKRVEDRLSLLLGILRDVGGRAGGRNVGSDGEVARGQGRPQAGST